MRKALILGLMMTAALSLAACGKPHPSPEPDPAAVSAPADTSAPTPADPAPPADADPAPQEQPGDGSQPADGEGAASVPAGTAVNPAEDEPEPPQDDPQQSPPEAGEEDPSARQPDPAEEEPRQPDPDPAGSSDDKTGGSAINKELIALIQAYLSSQQEGSQQSGAGCDPTDFSGSLGAYREYLDQIRNPEELRETAEKLFPGVSDYDIDWESAWQALETSRSG